MAIWGAFDTNVIRIGQGQTQTYIAGQINANGGGLTNVLFVNNLTSTNGYFNLVINGLGQITATFVATNVPGSLVNGAVVASAYATILVTPLILGRRIRRDMQPMAAHSSALCGSVGKRFNSRSG